MRKNGRKLKTEQYTERNNVIILSRKKKKEKRKIGINLDIMRHIGFLTTYIVACSLTAIICVSLICHFIEQDWDYTNGYLQYSSYFNLRDEVIILYDGDAITYEQLNSYLEIHFNLINLVQSNSEISSKDIKNYNNIIKEILHLKKDYEKHELKSTKPYIQGFKDGVQIYDYKRIDMS